MLWRPCRCLKRLLLPTWREYVFNILLWVNLPELFFRLLNSLSMCWIWTLVFVGKIQVPLSFVTPTRLVFCCRSCRALMLYQSGCFVRCRITWDRTSSVWLSSRSWKQPRIGSSVGLSALLSSKPEKTWDCELKHFFSSFSLIRLWKQPGIRRALSALIQVMKTT
jgi:hypothetical protein